MRVDIWSDVICPWCYLGKARFAKAMGSFAHRDEVEVVYRSFELDQRGWHASSASPASGSLSSTWRPGFPARSPLR